MQFCSLENAVVNLRVCTCPPSPATVGSCESATHTHFFSLRKVPASHLWQSCQVRRLSNFGRKFWQRLSLGAPGNCPLVPSRDTSPGLSRAPVSGGCWGCWGRGGVGAWGAWGGGASGLAGGRSAARRCQLHPPPTGKRKLPLGGELRPPPLTHHVPPPLPPPPLVFLRKSAAENSQKVPDVKSPA